MRLGLFGGTFDPVHLGHLDVVRAARAALALDCVWMIPSRVPPHRAQPRVSAAHRFAMVALATAGDQDVLVSAVELESPGQSYTADTLDRLAARGVDVGSAAFILGADAFREIASWKAYPEVLDRCHFAVVSRPGVPAASLRSALPALADRMHDGNSEFPVRPGILLVDAPTAPVSSTVVREAIARDADLTDLVPAGVASYIRRHGLYRPHDAPDDRFKGVA
jgi:nicotinate-nucleotide adenylyltransferase